MTQANGIHGAADRPAGLRRGASASGPSPSPASIPDKLYFRIGEVARLCAVQAYVLRFWETEFPQLRPTKGGTGQRLFRRRDVEMAMRIRRLLYDQGYTIPGARQLLRAESRPAPVTAPPSPHPLADPPPSPVPAAASGLRAIHQGLRDLQAILAHPPGAAPAAGHSPQPGTARRPRSPAFRRFRQELSAPLFDSPETAGPPPPFPSPPETP